MSKVFPSSARVVIVGGGIIGCSIAYHLTKLGWKDVVLIERKQLTCGTTWHAAGLLTTLRSTENQTWLAKYTQDLYKKLEEETGQATGYMGIGSIQIASSEVLLEEMLRGCDMAKCFDIESQRLTPGEIQEMWPLADVSDALAGFYFPNDGRTNPTDTTQALAKGARMGGASIFENTIVTEVLQEAGRATGVVTDKGEIKSDYVVNCTGMWAREFGLNAGVNVPLQAAEHYYLITENIEGMHSNLPILRDPNNQAYYREETGKLMLGLFEAKAAPWAVDGIPEHFCFDDLPPDWDRMMPYLEKAMKRVPSMQDAGIKLFFNGPESFTPDHNYLMGEAPELKNFFIAAGFNSLGILSAGGAGKVMADWIVDGHAPMDSFDTDIRRMQPFHNNKKFLVDRTVESLGIGYQYHWPFKQWETARGVKKLVLHEQVAKAGACFGESAGWERPNWYAPKGVEPKYEYSYGRQNWFDYTAEEHHAVRNNVGIFEQSSFDKIFVQGRDVEKYLNRICTNNVSVPVGKAVYTQWLNSRGTIEADLTVTRLEEDCYMVVTAGYTHTHVYYWLKQHIENDEFVVVTDVTTTMGMLNIQGPNSRKLMSKLCSTDFSNDAFPFGTMQDIEIGYSQLKALRITYMGELGWELYIPTEYLPQVYEAIVEEGKNFDLKHCGYHALASLRIEKAYREFGHDIGADDSPLEAGLMFASDFNKEGGFIGKEALLQFKKAGIPKRRLVQFLLKDPDPMMYHNEPIYRNGEYVGYISSAMYGYTLGACAGLGYVNHGDGVTTDFINQGEYEIQIAGKRYAAKASLKPMYDPAGERVKG